jgi:hypothetical protein
VEEEGRIFKKLACCLIDRQRRILLGKNIHPTIFIQEESRVNKTQTHVQLAAIFVNLFSAKEHLKII